MTASTSRIAGFSPAATQSRRSVAHQSMRRPFAAHCVGRRTMQRVVCAQQQQQKAKKQKEREPIPYSPPSEEGASLRAEVEAPFRSLRLVIFGASAASAALATLFALPALIGTLGGAPGARPLTDILQDLAINVGAMAVCGLIVRGDLDARQKQMARLLREDQLGACQLELANGRVLRLAQLRGFARVVVIAGTQQQVAAAVQAAQPYKQALVERGVLLVPLPLTSDAEGAGGEGGGGAASTSGSSGDGSSLGEVTKDDLRWRATPIRTNDWRQWFEDQARLANKTLDGGLYVSLRLDGRVRGSGVGCPPWPAMAASLPKTEGFFGGLLDGMDGKI